jgi:hypothetical protein
VRLITVVPFNALNPGVVERMDPEMNQIRDIGSNLDGRPKGLRGRRFQNGRERDDWIARGDEFVAERAQENTLGLDLILESRSHQNGDNAFLTCDGRFYFWGGSALREGVAERLREGLASQVLMVVSLDVQRCEGSILATVGKGDQLGSMLRIRQPQNADEFCGEQLSRLAEAGSEISQG